MGDDVTRPNQRVFSIFIKDRIFGKSVDVVGWTGGSGVTVYKDYVVNVPMIGSRQQNLKLVLQPDTETMPHWNNPNLNGLEIFKTNGS